MNSLALLLRFTVLHEYYITGILIIPGHIVIFMLCYHRSCDSSIGLHVLFMGKEVSFTTSFQEPKAGIYCQLSIGSCHYCRHQQYCNLFRQEKMDRQTGQMVLFAWLPSDGKMMLTNRAEAPPPVSFSKKNARFPNGESRLAVSDLGLMAVGRIVWRRGLMLTATYH